jgi:hypothetical protein
MAKVHQKASCKVKKADEEKKLPGRPQKEKGLSIRHKIPAHSGTSQTPGRNIAHSDGENCSEGCKDGISDDEEDELYGRQVSDDDGLDGAAVISKLQCRGSRKANRESVGPRGKGINAILQ